MNLSLIAHWQPGLLNRRPRSEFPGLQPKPGDQLRVGVLNGPMGVVDVLAVDDQFVDLNGELTLPVPTPLPFDLGLAYSRPKMFRRTFSSAIEMGFKQVDIFKSHLCQKSYLESDLYNDSELEALSFKALQQACDTQLPSWKSHKVFKPFVEDVLLQKYNPPQIVVADPAGECATNLQEIPEYLLIGPEKGFTRNEIKMCKDFGMSVVRFGDRHLRYETALPMITGQLLGLFLK